MIVISNEKHLAVTTKGLLNLTEQGFILDSTDTHTVYYLVGRIVHLEDTVRSLQIRCDDLEKSDKVALKRKIDLLVELEKKVNLLLESGDMHVPNNQKTDARLSPNGTKNSGLR